MAVSKKEYFEGHIPNLQFQMYVITEKKTTNPSTPERDCKETSLLGENPGFHSSKKGEGSVWRS